MHGPGFFGSYRDAVLRGCGVVEGGQTSTGSVVAWFRRTLCAPGTSYAQLDAEAAAVPPGSEGLVALDHFQVGRGGVTSCIAIKLTQLYLWASYGLKGSRTTSKRA